MNTWIIGAGGLLGSSLATTFPNNYQAAPINWANPDQSIDQLLKNFENFLVTTENRDESFCIIWAAGHATVSSDSHTCQRERKVFESFTQALTAVDTRGRGKFFLASSAGGVFAGSPNPPFSNDSPTMATSEYGRLKLDQENAALKLTEWQVSIGRISNLYGPGQDLSKLQGLISRLVLAALEKRTINIFVPLDTIRDFIFVRDAAETIREIIGSQDAPVVSVIASGEPKSLGAVIQQVQDIIRIKIPVAFGIHSSSGGQAPDLRMIPTISVPHVTPFPAGVKLVIADLLDRLQNQ
jgi:UDP-glucose 4-epimerase